MAYNLGLVHLNTSEYASAFHHLRYVANAMNSIVSCHRCSRRGKLSSILQAFPSNESCRDCSRVVAQVIAQGRMILTTVCFVTRSYMNRLLCHLSLSLSFAFLFLLTDMKCGHQPQARLRGVLHVLGYRSGQIGGLRQRLQCL